MHNNMPRGALTCGGYAETAGFAAPGEFVFPQNGKIRPGKFPGRIWI
jgi:hypothetical protein